MVENTLTIQELEAAHFAEFDLGPGYPQLEPPGYVTRAYREDSLEELAIQFAPIWTRSKQRALDEDLDVAVRRFIGFPLESDRATHGARFTFSGSIALDRCISAAERLVRASGRSKYSVITTTPCIDIMRLFLTERASAVPVFVHSNAGGVAGCLDLEAVIGAIRREDRYPRRGLVVLLTSPENPTGESWSSAHLRSIAREVADRKGILIVDHTFAVTGVQTQPIDKVWDAVEDCDWFAVWDTGKTFGLNEDKIGAIFCGSAKARTALDDALAVLQFGIARRQQLFFASVLQLARYHGHIDLLREVMRENLNCLTELLPTRIRVPIAGSMALVDVSPLDAEDVRRDLLTRGVGVISGDVFFHDSWKPVSWIRLALARDPSHFREGASRVALYLDRA